MRTLRRYVWKQVAGAIALVMGALLMLFAFFDLIQELSDVGKGSYSVGMALLKVTLAAPGHVYELFPIGALLGTLFALAQLVANSEYTVMRVCGVSARRMAAVLAPLGLLFALTAFLVGEFVAPLSEAAAQRMLLKARNTGVIAQEFRSGLWVKDDNNFVNVAQVSTDNVLRGVRIYEFDGQHRLRAIRDASTGTFRGGSRWTLADVVSTEFSGEGARVRRSDTQDWESVLNPGILEVLMVVPERMAFGTLFEYVQHLRDNRQATQRHEIALFSKVVYPLAVVVMMLLALPFAYFRVREGGVSGKLFAGIMLGLGFHVASRLFGHLGLLNAWPPLFAAAFPTALFLAAAFALMWFAERR